LQPLVCDRPLFWEPPPLFWGEKTNKKKERKKGEFHAGLYPLGIERRNTTPHAIN
jgi:hypothetical protein